jgi:uncharacterized protein YdiU (UPF0061 family)
MYNCQLSSLNELLIFKTMSKIEYSYLTLPTLFYERVLPHCLPKPEITLLNQALLNVLGIPDNNLPKLLSFLQLADPNPDAQTFAQAYAGHQFGHFTMLGDGRAIIVGEWVQTENLRYDIQLKGGGRTKYSRGGDGKATFKAMLREYLISEAMFHLNIATSRSLGVIKTGEWVQREMAVEGAVLPRIMKSHIRIGTFEFARHFGTLNDLTALCNYSINRLYPQLKTKENTAAALLETVMVSQINLICEWMRVGFIHGVMNTDNVAISGETFDYGPCAFMNTYNPNTVYSSIDRDGRYAFKNQANICKWNITRFAEALLPLLHTEEEKAILIAKEIIGTFDQIWVNQYYKTMLLKLGITEVNISLCDWVNELLKIMEEEQMDYTNTFLALGNPDFVAETHHCSERFSTWRNNWEKYIENSIGLSKAQAIMQVNNPAFIPRNHEVEKALDEMSMGNAKPFENLLQVLQNPYTYNPTFHSYTNPPQSEFDKKFKTFCGT